MRSLGVPEPAANDVVQDVFLVVHRRLGDYDGHTPVRRWLLGIVTRVVADHRRRYWRKDSRCIPHEVDKDGGETLPSLRPTPLEEVEEGARVLARCMEAAPHEARTLGQAFLDAHPLSPLSGRVRATCGLDVAGR